MSATWRRVRRGRAGEAVTESWAGLPDERLQRTYGRQEGGRPEPPATRGPSKEPHPHHWRAAQGPQRSSRVGQRHLPTRGWRRTRPARLSRPLCPPGQPLAQPGDDPGRGWIDTGQLTEDNCCAMSGGEARSSRSPPACSTVSQGTCTRPFPDSIATWSSSSSRRWHMPAEATNTPEDSRRTRRATKSTPPVGGGPCPARQPLPMALKWLLAFACPNRAAPAA